MNENKQLFFRFDKTKDTTGGKTITVALVSSIVDNYETVLVPTGCVTPIAGVPVDCRHQRVPNECTMTDLGIDKVEVPTGKSDKNGQPETKMIDARMVEIFVPENAKIWLPENKNFPIEQVPSLYDDIKNFPNNRWRWGSVDFTPLEIVQFRDKKGNLIREEYPTWRLNFFSLLDQKPGQETSYFLNVRSMQNKPELISSLNILAATTYAMVVKTHGYHWNVKGQNFQQYHRFLGELYEALVDDVDAFAEHIRALGEPAPQGIDLMAQLSIATKEQPDNSSIQPILADLVTNFNTLNSLLKTVINQADDVLANYLLGKVDEYNKIIWQLSSSQEPNLRFLRADKTNNQPMSKFKKGDELSRQTKCRVMSEPTEKDGKLRYKVVIDDDDECEMDEDELQRKFGKAESKPEAKDQKPAEGKKPTDKGEEDPKNSKTRALETQVNDLSDKLTQVLEQISKNTRADNSVDIVALQKELEIYKQKEQANLAVKFTNPNSSNSTNVRAEKDGGEDVEGKKDYTPSDFQKELEQAKFSQK